MPPLVVNRIESDGDGGFFIEWRDPSNLDGQPLTGFFHVTEQSVTELLVHQRRPNRAPEDKLIDVLTGLRDGAPMAQVGQMWRLAYDEILTDRIDRHNFGMKAVTKGGHADLVAVRGGAKVSPENRVDARPQGFQDFIDRL
jgi:hypothetical protein